MAKCPKCNENWFWDWEQDIFRYIDGSEVKIIELNCTEEGMELELIVFQCKCGAINSAMYIDKNRGSAVCSIEKWKNVDWEWNEDSWKPECLSCKDRKNCLEEN